MVNCYIQLIKLAQTSIVLTYQSKVYIFNVPEGFQRYISDFCIKMKPSPQIFFTKINVDSMNGLIGLLLTLNFDKQIEQAKLYGPKGLCDFMSAFRYSEIGGKNINNISCHEFFGKNLYYQNKEQLIAQLSEGNKYPVLSGLKLVKLDDNLSIDRYSDPYLDIVPIMHINNNISYSITTHIIKGNVSNEKLGEFKFSTQQKKELFQNHQILIEDQLYQEDTFREPDIEEQSILILDIIEDADLQQIKLPKNLKCIFHITDPKTIEYQNFIARVPTDHLFCSQEIKNQYSDNLPKTKSICNYLHTLFPENFPLFHSLYSPQLLGQQLQQQSYYCYNLLPLCQAGYKEISPQMIGSLSQIRQIDYQFQLKQKQYQSIIKLQFLGTASMRPNKYRNVSGILIESPEFAVILDCGESTFDQLAVQRNFDFNKKMLIWISHVHCDHNLGLATMMKSVPNLFLLVPQIMVPWIIQLKKIYQIQNNFQICVIPSREYGLEQEFQNQYSQTTSFDQITLEQLNNLFQIQLNYVNVDHCPQAYGLRINFKDGTSLSYSGDTRPCDSFIKLSSGVDIMIHEATFTDDLYKNAINRKHSTIREAVESAVQVEAKTLILTHFSQRYCKQGTCQQQEQAMSRISPLNQIAYEQFLKKKTVIALDFLSGLMDEYPDLVELSQELQQIVE